MHHWWDVIGAAILGSIWHYSVQLSVHIPSDPEFHSWDTALRDSHKGTWKGANYTHYSVCVCVCVCVSVCERDGDDLGRIVSSRLDIQGAK